MTACVRLPWNENDRDRLFAEVRRRLDDGGLVAFPTDTVWGVGGLATKSEAVNRLYELKGKKRSQPLPCLVHSAEAALACFDNPSPPLVDLVARHWPGALTVVATVRPGLLPHVRAGLPTAGLRMPDCPNLLALLAALPAPLASSSANLHGESPLPDADAILEILGDRLAAIVEWDQPFSERASTVVEVQGASISILRRGDLAAELEGA